jgi:hypothetical protein
MVKDFKAAYKTIMDDHFTPGLEEVIYQAGEKRVLFRPPSF